MERRGFFELVLGFAGASWLCGSTSTNAPPSSKPPIYKRVFRGNELSEWREIHWDDIKTGDKLLELDLKDGHLFSLEAFEALSSPDPNDPVGMIHVGYHKELLPKVLGQSSF